MHLTAKCRCGGVAIEANGAPITSTICYCADCQAGARQLEALPNAESVREPNGGTAYILYRKDRFNCTVGLDLLKAYKIKEASATNRVVAKCCNTAMFVNFDRGPHWVSAYRARFQGGLPPLQMRICTKSKPYADPLPTDVPNYPGYPPKLIFTLLASRIAMLVGR
jgi:hypothetical protein